MSVVLLKPFAKLRRIENKRIHRGKGPVDLLIGIDHAQMNTGHTKQTRQLVREICLFGGLSEDAQGNGHVCHVGFAAPVHPSEV